MPVSIIRTSCAALALSLASAALGSDLPLLRIQDLIYEGAFRLPASTYGASSLNFSQGPIEYDDERNSLYIVGHAHHQAIAEFTVPELVVSTDLSALRMATAPAQPFATVLDRATGGNPQNVNRIGGLELATHDGRRELLINGYEYYDADGNVTETTLVARAPRSLSTSTIDGFFTLRGGGGHTGGWISPIPERWQATLGGTHISGQSSGIPIISRASVGPSAFAFDVADLVGSARGPGVIPTIALLDFSLAHPLRADLSNASRNNDVWTHLSRVVYGWIVPGTRTYMTIGSSGGHASGVCYKCTQSDGTLCGGYCAPDASDYTPYYWLWDVDDLVAVRNGVREPHRVEPYDHGAFPTPFATREIGGGTFDPSSGRLYLTAQRADRAQGTYANPPVVVVFRPGPESSRETVMPLPAWSLALLALVLLIAGRALRHRASPRDRRCADEDAPKRAGHFPEMPARKFPCGRAPR